MKRAFKSEYYDLPIKYEKTAVKLLVQSPTRMYAYWDVSDESINKFSSTNTEYKNCIPFLKITNLTMNYSYEIEINPFANNFYIDVKDPDCVYKVELIRKSNDISYVVSSSNEARIPRSSPCEYTEDIVFRNCVCLSVTDKFKIYTLNRTNLKKYTDLSIYDDNVSSFTNMTK